MVPQKSPVPGVCLHPGLFMGKKRIRLFGYFYVAFRPHQRTKNTTFYIFANWKKQVETPPSRWFHRCVLGRTIPGPQSSLLTDSSSISLSYSRTFAFPFAESIIIQLSPASLSGSLITHDKSVHASIYTGLRGRNSPSWGLWEARCHHGAFPPSGSDGIILVSLPSRGWAACNLSHTLKNIPTNRRQI